MRRREKNRGRREIIIIRRVCQKLIAMRDIHQDDHQQQQQQHRQQQQQQQQQATLSQLAKVVCVCVLELGRERSALLVIE